MSNIQSLTDFLTPVNVAEINNDEGYKEGQIGKVIDVYQDTLPDVTQADYVLVGCSEMRGGGFHKKPSAAADAIRRQFYSLYYWHPDIQLADLGNIKTGASLQDSYAAMKTVIKELTAIGKRVIILGGSHDNTLAQYQAYADEEKMIEATCVDALIDLNTDSYLACDNFLMEMLTGEPNFVRHYNHIGFQSYFMHPYVLETIDKLRFDCFRVGHVKDNIAEMEPVIRNSNLFSFDMSAIAHAYAPAGAISPNGLTGEEACTLMRYAGMSDRVNTIGIYGYEPEKDGNQLTASQISHMIWYLIDGRNKGKREAAFAEADNFYEFHVRFAEIDTTFLQSKRTGRWWMTLPDKQFIACSYKDYLQASNNEIPERWFRVQERP